MPLDLADSAIMGTFEEFMRARESLDENGWRKDRVILQAFRQRAQLMLSTIREEALELKLDLRR